MANVIEGNVAEIGATGSLITNISIDQLENVPEGENTSVKFGEHETMGIFPTEHDQPDSTMVASKGKSGFLEIEIVGISLSEMLGIKTGEKITIQW